MTFEEREEFIDRIAACARKIREDRSAKRGTPEDCMPNIEKLGWRKILVFIEEKLYRLQALAEAETLDLEAVLEETVDIRNYSDFVSISAADEHAQVAKPPAGEQAIQIQKWIIDYLERLAPRHPDARNVYIGRAKEVLEYLEGEASPAGEQPDG